MASAAYRRWIADGSPWHPAQPIAELFALLRRYGYTVYILGDNSHQTASTPEDHTAFSATGWPNANPYPWVHACDIMPPGGSLPSLGVLGRQLANDKNAGVFPALKYMNWQPAGQGVQHWKWQPNQVITSSTDAGHIHLSIRSDFTHASIGAYDPIARIHGGGGEGGGGAVPPFPGTVLRNPTTGHGTRTWQAKMRERGWSVDVDDQYGPASARVCRQFQAEKGLAQDGEVGPQTWAATWETPVT